MPSSKLVLAGAALMLTVLTLPVPTASAGTACVVGPGDDACFFVCLPGEMVQVTAFGGLRGATIVGQCGSVVAACTAPAGAFCSAVSGRARVGGQGVCLLDEHHDPPFLPNATGRCDAAA